MLTVTTPTVSGSRIVKHFGIVSGEAILGANIFRDFFAGIRDIVGGRSAAYEEELRKAKAIAIQEMQQQATELGANAVDRRGPRLRDDPDGGRRRHADGERQRHRRDTRGRRIGTERMMERATSAMIVLAFVPVSPSTAGPRREAPVARRLQRARTRQSISPASGWPSSRKTGDGA